MTINLITIDAVDETEIFALTGFRINTDGTVQIIEGSYSFLNNWMTPLGGAAVSGFEARLTRISGVTSLTSGNLATWESLSSAKEYTLSSSVGPRIFTGTIEIRIAGGGATVASASVSLAPNSSP